MNDKDSETDRQTVKQTDRQTVKQTDRQSELRMSVVIAGIKRGLLRDGTHIAKEAVLA